MRQDPHLKIFLAFAVALIESTRPALGPHDAFASPYQRERDSNRATETLRMSRPVACRSIDGYEDYEILPRSELTSEEKLLVYVRPRGYKVVTRGKEYVAHFTQDGQIRRKGSKAVLLRKKNLLDYEAKSPQPPDEIYLRNSFSLKGLTPGEYEYDLILRDENSPGTTVIATVEFRIIPIEAPKPSRKAEDE